MYCVCIIHDSDKLKDRNHTSEEWRTMTNGTQFLSLERKIIRYWGLNTHTIEQTYTTRYNNLADLLS